MQKIVRIDVKTEGSGICGRRFVMDDDSPGGYRAALGELRAWLAENLPEALGDPWTPEKAAAARSRQQNEAGPEDGRRDESGSSSQPEPAPTFREAGLALAAKVAHDGKFYMSPAEADIVRTGMVLEWIDASGNGELKAEVRDEAGRTLAERTVAVGEKEFDRLVDMLFGSDEKEAGDGE